VSETIALCYHGVSETWAQSLAVRPAALAQQVGWYLRRGYRAVTVAEAAAVPADQAGGPRVVITFDDAMRSVHALALPVLERLGAVATVYAPTHYVTSGEPMAWPEVARHLETDHAAELAPMSVAELADVAARGWEVGSHTRTHPWLPRLDDAALAHELRESKRELETLLEAPCRTLAYPFGAHDERVAAATAAAGYEAAVTLPARLPAWPRRPQGLELMTLPRLGVYHADDWHRFRIKASAPVRALRRTPLWDGLGAIKRVAR
jgi:peptidoglycan/xylan/chitin deacetylase (PgdA/CDA1 family)